MFAQDSPRFDPQQTLQVIHSFVLMRTRGTSSWSFYYMLFIITQRTTGNVSGLVSSFMIMQDAEDASSPEESLVLHSQCIAPLHATLIYCPSKISNIIIVGWEIEPVK